MDDRQSNSRIILPKSITISKDHREILIKHAQSAFPAESCALLFGKDDGILIHISEVFLAENLQKSPTRFTISNEELIKAYSQAEKAGLDVVGIFHSHPHSEALPSATDRKFMLVNPVAWIIFSNKTGKLMAYIEDSEIPIAIKIL